MQPRRFPIGFWNSGENYLPVMDQWVEEWADLGFSLAMTPNFGDSPAELAQVRRLLDLAHARDIELILCDNRTHGPGSPWGDPAMRVPLPDGYAAKVAAAVRDFGDHPAAWGLYVVDEPLQGNLPGVGEACQIVRAATPRLHPYVNLLPDHIIWDGVAKHVGFTDFNAYLDHYLAVTGDDMLCFDCYCQKGEEWGGWDRYFLNLAEYQAAAIRHHVPFWIITLALGHWIYRAPTVPEMLRQFNTALAYGAQGILYFLYRAGGDFGYGAPVDELGQRGPLYYQLKRQHTYFRRYWESRYRTLKPTLTSHFPTAPAGTHLFNGTGIAKKIGFGVGDTDILVGEFVDDQQRPHVMIVNNNTERHVSVGVDCVGRKAYHLGEKGEVPCAESASGLVQVGGFLMPAAAQLYRIEPGT